MKFYNITSTNLKQPLLPLFLVFCASIFQAQNASLSPYSRFGIGDLQAIQTPRNAAMGGLSVGLIGTSSLSTKNPASYMNLGKDTVVFDVSLQGVFSRLQEKQLTSEIVSARTNSASLGQISLAIPITSWVKTCFGLTPNSNMSYNVSRIFSGNPNIGTYILRNYGHGGTNQVFLGLAVGTDRVAVGANANYQFGSFVRSVQVNFIADNDSTPPVLPYPTTTVSDRYLEAAGLFWDLGFQYRQPLSNRYQLGFGFTYTPAYKLNATQSLWDYAMITDLMRDTITHGIPEDGKLKMPSKYAVGLSFEKLNRWVIGAEYSMIDFTKYQEFSKTDPNLSKAYTFRTGMELKGQRMDNDFFNRLSYRFGCHYGTNYIIFQNSEIKQFGFNFGVGMPIRRTLSRIDFAVEFGRKGSVNAGQIQENYGRVIIGISAFDRWFVRGKFD
ncbi:MAG: hypothetical protein LBP96_00600 [Bacteroidales bacterium]|jgi:hypothetical protein|nr:hypothetical protein [Bacteroidales bacterium]